MFKKIFFITLFAIPLLGADHKKMKYGTLIETPENTTSIGFDCIPDEIALNITEQFTNRLSCNLDDVKSLISLSIVSKHMHALVRDKSISAQQSTQNLLLTNTPVFSNRINTLNKAQKIALLDAINAIPSDNIKAVACQRLAHLTKPLFSEPVHHKLINHAIEKSNLSLFQSCYTMFNIAQDHNIPSALRLGATLMATVRKHMVNTNSIMKSGNLSTDQEGIQLEALQAQAEQIAKQLSNS